jgi:hypothetical protein
MSVLVAYHLGKLIDGRRIGILSSLITALSSVSIYYSLEIRPYPVYGFLSAFLMYAYLRAHGTPLKDEWLRYGILVLLCGLSHAISVSLFVAIAATELIEYLRSDVTTEKQQSILYAAGGGIVCGVCGLSWLLKRPDLGTKDIGGMYQLGVVDFFQTFFLGLAGYPRRFGLDQTILINASLSFIFAAIGIWVLCRRPKKTAGILFLALLITHSVFLFGSLGPMSPWSWIKYAISLFIPFNIAMAIGLDFIFRKVGSALIMPALVVLALAINPLNAWFTHASELRAADHVEAAQFNAAWRHRLKGVILQDLHGIRAIQIYSLYRSDELPVFHLSGAGLHRIYFFEAAFGPHDLLDEDWRPLRGLPTGLYSITAFDKIEPYCSRLQIPERQDLVATEDQVHGPIRICRLSRKTAGGSDDALN